MRASKTDSKKRLASVSPRSNSTDIAAMIAGRLTRSNSFACIVLLPEPGGRGLVVIDGGIYRVLEGVTNRTPDFRADATHLRKRNVVRLSPNWTSLLCDGSTRGDVMSSTRGVTASSP
jgi:hypothetical protein